MRASLLLICGAALLSGTGAAAQSLPSVEHEEASAVVRDPEIVFPEFDPASEVLVFRVLDFNLDAADIPFLIDRTGIVVPRTGLEDAVRGFLAEARTAVYVCSFPAGERPDILRPQVRSRVCSLRRS